MESFEGVKLELVDVGVQEMPEGDIIPLPNVILGSLGNDPNKKTVSTRTPGLARLFVMLLWLASNDFILWFLRNFNEQPI